MIIHDFSVTVPSHLSKQLSVPLETCLFFDIETTGLSWKRSHLYLLGAVFYTEDGWIHRQWFCQKPSEEQDVLLDFAGLLKEKETLIHFNGTTFDLPYLMHKYTFYQMDTPWDAHPQLDLYQKLLPFKKLLGLDHMRQKDLEQYIGLHRKDPFTGQELIACYQEYLKTGDERLEQALLLHNREDVEGMLALLPLLCLPRLFTGRTDGAVEAALSESASDLPRLILTLSEPLPLPLHLRGETSLYELLISEGNVSLHIPILEGTLKYFFPDYQNYYYLPLEDRAIHKSVGAYVDKTHRQKARASNCYQKQDGKFLPQFSDLFTPAFRSDCKDKTSWFLLREELLSDPDFRSRYASHLLSGFLRK